LISKLRKVKLFQDKRKNYFFLKKNNWRESKARRKIRVYIFDKNRNH